MSSATCSSWYKEETNVLTELKQPRFEGTKRGHLLFCPPVPSARGYIKSRKLTLLITLGNVVSRIYINAFLPFSCEGTWIWMGKIVPPLSGVKQDNETRKSWPLNSLPVLPSLHSHWPLTPVLSDNHICCVYSSYSLSVKIPLHRRSFPCTGELNHLHLRHSRVFEGFLGLTVYQFFCLIH